MGNVVLHTKLHEFCANPKNKAASDGISPKYEEKEKIQRPTVPIPNWEWVAGPLSCKSKENNTQRRKSNMYIYKVAFKSIRPP